MRNAVRGEDHSTYERARFLRVKMRIHYRLVRDNQTETELLNKGALRRRMLATSLEIPYLSRDFLNNY